MTSRGDRPRSGPSPSDSTNLGRTAEELVAVRLEQDGYEVLARNARVGRYELDVIARKGSMLVVCEVRARSENQLGISPVESIDARKIHRIRRATAGWLATNPSQTNEIRFDAAAVTSYRDGRIEIDYFEDAF